VGEPQRVLIQCVGNRLRRDDGAGPAVADRLRDFSLPGTVTIQEHWGEGTTLLAHWDPGSWVVLVDASSSGAAPGSIRRFDARDQAAPKGFCYYATHRFGVAEAIELARSLGRLPERIELYAIEGADFGLGTGMTPEVSGAVRTLADMIAARLREGA
jgi:hydrogenase maturation protease